MNFAVGHVNGEDQLTFVYFCRTRTGNSEVLYTIGVRVGSGMGTTVKNVSE